MGPPARAATWIATLAVALASPVVAAAPASSADKLTAATASGETRTAATCRSIAERLVKTTRTYRKAPRGSRRFVVPGDVICHDFTGDGRRDMAFAIASGGTGGAFKFAVYRRTRSRSRRLGRRFSKLIERGFGSKTQLRRRGRRLQVFNPIFRDGDPNCCPTGGAYVRSYRFTRTKAVYLGRRRVKC